MRYILIAIFLLCCTKKKDVQPAVYTPPAIDWDDDLDIDDLPEAGDEDDDEESQ